MKGGSMAANVGKLSTDELREIIGSVVEQKLKEILGDPDDGLEMRADVRNRLLRQKKAVAKGERGEELEEVAKRLRIA
jgi:hypothetical protein